MHTKNKSYAPQLMESAGRCYRCLGDERRNDAQTDTYDSPMAMTLRDRAIVDDTQQHSTRQRVQPCIAAAAKAAAETPPAVLDLDYITATAQPGHVLCTLARARPSNSVVIQPVDHDRRRRRRRSCAS